MSPAEGDAQAVAEAEVKVELASEAFAAIPPRLRALGFEATGEQELIDHYLAFRESPIRGFEFTRVRVIDRQASVLTQKRWVRDAAGHPVRLEEERTLSPTELEALLPPERPVPSLAKRRSNFCGRIDDLPALVSLDCLELEGRTRYFVECEVRTRPEHSRETRERLLAWMRANLPVGDAAEAPTMLELLLRATGDAGPDPSA
ncbi:MAG: CYTH domain-containing protein [Armatimonadetes bacterium]|nr:CYTH domain-containing protein [Armatimonadota bacterium]